MVPSGIIFHNRFNVPFGSGALLISVFLATCFLLFISTEVLSPSVILNLSGVILIGDVCLHLDCLCLARGIVSDSASEFSGVLYCYVQIWFGVRKVLHFLLVEHWASEDLV